MTFSNCEIISQIYESSNSIVYRGIRTEDRQPIILKLLKQDFPTPDEIRKYHQEYEITRSLNIDGIPKVYGLDKYQNTLVMFLEDFGGQSLRFIMDNRRFTLPEFMDIAIKITDILEKIHGANIIHKDINPANIVFHLETKEVKIIDFGISTKLHQENPILKNPNVLEGTLAYMSPEQTGRMNRSLDYRTDFYSLGATFYEMLTGELPFKDTADAMELVHCHLAKQPIPPCEINPEIPQAISDIVIKLLAKTAEDRYQSSIGIKADLMQCLNQLETTGKISLFTLGSQDISNEFQIPQKLYGREAEVETLLAAFDRVSGIQKEEEESENPQNYYSEMMLISGYSGIGKSALVQEIYKPITQQRGYFIAGKFDQFQRNIPYSAIVSAFQSLIRQLLTENETQLNQWKEKLLTAFGPNGILIIDVIPEVELIVGKQPDVAELGPAESQNRFNLVFQNFIRIFCQKEHPLVIFLDDLQWADFATLKLIELMMKDDELGYLLLIGAYRDNEVSSTHPTIITIEGLRKEGVAIEEITLKTLNLEHISQMIAESLYSDRETVKPLAELVLSKTNGNPFFVNQFLKTLAQENLLVREIGTRKWQWNIAQIEAKGITDNVVDLMISKLRKLPESTQQVLRLASCVGNKFDLQTLSIIHEKSAIDTFQDIQPTIQENFLIPLSEFSIAEKIGEQIDLINSPLLIFNYKFLHDRVQQAAYALIDGTLLRITHLKIGQLLLKNIPQNELEMRIFEVVDHLNLAKDLIADETEKVELARLNLSAGKKAKDATAYGAALEYLKSGLDCLSGDFWTAHYDLALALHKERAEVEFLNGHFEESEAFIDAILNNVKSDLEKAEIYNLLLVQYTMSAKYLEAIAIGQKALALLGIDLPNDNFQEALDIEVSLAKANLGSRNIAGLINEPEIADPQKRLAIKLLTNTDPPAYFGKQEMYGVIVAKVANLSLQYGNIAESSKGFVTYGIILGSVLGDYQSGYEFGKLSVAVSEKFKDWSQKCSACLVLGGHLNHWVKHIKFAEALFNDSYQAGLQCGELRHSGYALEHQLRYLFYQGKPLENLVTTVAKYLQFSQKNKNQWATDGMLGFQIILFNLTSKTPDKLIFCNNEIDDEQFLIDCHAHNSFAWVCTYNIFKSQVLYLYDRMNEALKCAEEAEKFISFVLGHFQGSEHNFHTSLILAALYIDADESDKQKYWERLEANQKRMKIWADNCPENFLHKYLLVAAEMARISGKWEEAMNLYDSAILSARENEFIQNEALANELAAKFWLGKGKEEFAQNYLKKAQYAYQIWGATRKVEYLQAQYPQLLIRISETKSPETKYIKTTKLQTSNSSSSSLDLATVVKASQAIAGEIVLDKLLAKLMELAIENAGAQKGFLLLLNNGILTIEAMGEVDGEVRVLESLLVDSQNLPQAIVNYVARTNTPVILSDAVNEGIYIQDAYVILNQPKSVLCTPIVNQGKAIGMIYLENNLTVGAFTPERLEVLKILSSQAAISLENALLYRTLEQKVKDRTAELATANQEITKLNERLKADNIRMSAELEVTRKLQQIILPRESELCEIEGLDIAGFMEPADEVGGDYYDVLKYDGRVKIGIGDVTGHGLESGVLMIMVQAAIRTLLVNNETDSAKFFQSLNRMVYDNVLRMKSNKNMTLVLLDYQDNTLRVSGQHENIIVVRANSNEVDLIDTENLGFPIGIVDDITDFVTETEINLNSGDVVLLYTDGITEAIDLNRVEYGIEQLCESVRQNSHKSALEIRLAVIADLREHIGTQKVYDDITMLVLKQK
ncbi:serine/threonine protein kinase [Oscillatoriales cyanobacterium USR001]|nr:serine/threonine protein kinase [Oscillatoriales cyanobacterium USR001]